MAYFSCMLQIVYFGISSHSWHSVRNVLSKGSERNSDATVGALPSTTLTFVLTLEDPQWFVKGRSVGVYLGLSGC